MRASSGPAFVIVTVNVAVPQISTGAACPLSKSVEAWSPEPLVAGACVST